jgi:proteasome accessory factor C
VALASSLSQEGRAITAENISNSLGVSFDDARHLIALVSMGSGESIDYLPVILSDEDDEVQLMEGALLAAPRVRLTRSETIALVAALSELGIEESDPLVQTLTSSYVAPAFSVDDISRSLETPSSASDGKTLRLCSQAISEGRALGFWYTPVTGGSGMNRLVVPQRVRRTDDSWYLDAFDMARGADRVFRLDRMSGAVLYDIPSNLRKQQEKSIDRMVTVRFEAPEYLNLFNWEGLVLLAREGDTTTVRLPLYGGDWLARHLAACGGTVRTGDQALARQIADYAGRTLNELAR